MSPVTIAGYRSAASLQYLLLWAWLLLDFVKAQLRVTSSMHDVDDIDG